jgi:O-antigen/teichoic acid export membrane protein
MELSNYKQNVLNRLEKVGLDQQRLLDYMSLLGGQVGRLIFSMVYFITLARALSLSDFGIFATSSSIGIVLSRLSGLGFVSPLFRVATTKPSLLGVYTAGFLVASVVTLPVLLSISFALHWLIYAELITLLTFVLIVMAEVLFWRGLEAVIIVNNGLNKYTLASSIGIASVAVKAVAAAIFWYLGYSDLEMWAEIYFAVLGASLFVAVVLFYPKQKLKWRPAAWKGRLRDALGVSTAECIFYIQSEMDKVLVLVLGGEMLAGIYAIVMRLVDLTAMPLRALSTMLTQWIMRQRQSGQFAKTGLKLDALISFVSVAALITIAVLLSFFPNFLGKSISMGAAFLWLILLVPAFRNAVELHTDLLYGHERMASRVYLLIVLALAKAAMLALILSYTNDFATVAVWLNAAFGVLYLISAVVVYKFILGKTPVQAANK